MRAGASRTEPGNPWIESAGFFFARDGIISGNSGAVLLESGGNYYRCAAGEGGCQQALEGPGPELVDVAGSDGEAGPEEESAGGYEKGAGYACHGEGGDNGQVLCWHSFISGTGGWSGSSVPPGTRKTCRGLKRHGRRPLWFLGRAILAHEVELKAVVDDLARNVCTNGADQFFDRNRLECLYSATLDAH